MPLRFLHYSIVAILTFAALTTLTQAGVLKLTPISEVGVAQELGVSKDTAAWVSEDGTQGNVQGECLTDSGAVINDEKIGEVEEASDESTSEEEFVPTSTLTRPAAMEADAASVRQPGDANDDGFVDQTDVDILTGNWQATVGNGATSGDFNDDGKVDGSDVAILAGHWGARPADVPEPSTIILLLSGIIGLVISRRFRRA